MIAFVVALRKTQKFAIVQRLYGLLQGLVAQIALIESGFDCLYAEIASFNLELVRQIVPKSLTDFGFKLLFEVAVEIFLGFLQTFHCNFVGFFELQSHCVFS